MGCELLLQSLSVCTLPEFKTMVQRVTIRLSYTRYATPTVCLEIVVIIFKIDVW